MANLPTQPAVAKAYTPISVQPFAPKGQPAKSFVNEDLGDWEVAVATTLGNAVPADVNKTVITLHRHEIVIEREDFLYRALTRVEDSLIIASSIFLMGISATSILFALSTMAIKL